MSATPLFKWPGGVSVGTVTDRRQSGVGPVSERLDKDLERKKKKKKKKEMKERELIVSLSYSFLMFVRPLTPTIKAHPGPLQYLLPAGLMVA
jgi:hypothetical protein